MNQNLINQQGQSMGEVYGGNPESENGAVSDGKLLTIEDVNAAIVAVVQPFVDKLTEAMKGGFSTKDELNRAVAGLQLASFELRNRIPTDDHILEKAREVVPGCLRNLDSGGVPRTGNVLMLAPAPAGTAGNADSCYFGEIKVNGFTVKGIETLYYAVTLREYDENGVIVARGGEVLPLPTGHTLKPTWDVVSIPDETTMAFSVTTIVGTLVTIYEGTVVHGTRAAIVVPTQSFTVVHGQIAGVSYSLGSGTATLGLYNSFPLSGSGTYVKALHKFNVVGGVASIACTYYKGSIQIDGCYA